MLTTRRMEHGTPLLVDFDLGALVGAQEGFKKQDPEAVTHFIKVLSMAGKAQAIRRLSAMARATEDQLRLAEGDPTVLAGLEEEAAGRPFAESFKDAIGFFTEWGSSFGIAPVSSGQGKVSKPKKDGRPGSPSAGS